MLHFNEHPHVGYKNHSIYNELRSFNWASCCKIIELSYLRYPSVLINNYTQPGFRAQPTSKQLRFGCDIWGYHAGYYERYWFPSCDELQSGRSLFTLCSNAPRPSSGYKHNSYPYFDGTVSEYQSLSLSFIPCRSLKRVEPNSHSPQTSSRYCAPIFVKFDLPLKHIIGSGLLFSVPFQTGRWLQNTSFVQKIPRPSL
jgi:hypothetical protein